MSARDDDFVALVKSNLDSICQNSKQCTIVVEDILEIIGSFEMICVNPLTLNQESLHVFMENDDTVKKFKSISIVDFKASVGSAKKSGATIKKQCKKLDTNSHISKRLYAAMEMICESDSWHPAHEKSNNEPVKPAYILKNVITTNEDDSFREKKNQEEDENYSVAPANDDGIDYVMSVTASLSSISAISEATRLAAFGEVNNMIHLQKVFFNARVLCLDRLMTFISNIAKVYDDAFIVEMLYRFSCELKSLRYLPGVQIYAIVENNDGNFVGYVMQRCLAGSLKTYLTNQCSESFNFKDHSMRSVHEMEKIEICRDISNCVDRMHECDIAHMDLKPSNFGFDPYCHYARSSKNTKNVFFVSQDDASDILQPCNRVKIIDFGSSVIYKSSCTRKYKEANVFSSAGLESTSKDHIPTTEGYESIEYLIPVLRYDKYWDPMEYDIYGLGVIIFDLISMHQPFSSPRYSITNERSSVLGRDEKMANLHRVSKALGLYGGHLQLAQFIMSKYDKIKNKQDTYANQSRSVSMLQSLLTFDTSSQLNQYFSFIFDTISTCNFCKSFFNILFEMNNHGGEQDDKDGMNATTDGFSCSCNGCMILKEILSMISSSFNDSISQSIKNVCEKFNSLYNCNIIALKDHYLMLRPSTNVSCHPFFTLMSFVNKCHSFGINLYEAMYSETMPSINDLFDENVLCWTNVSNNQYEMIVHEIVPVLQNVVDIVLQYTLKCCKNASKVMNQHIESGNDDSMLLHKFICSNGLQVKFTNYDAVLTFLQNDDQECYWSLPVDVINLLFQQEDIKNDMIIAASACNSILKYIANSSLTVDKHAVILQHSKNEKIKIPSENDCVAFEIAKQLAESALMYHMHACDYTAPFGSREIVKRIYKPSDIGGHRPKLSLSNNLYRDAITNIAHEQFSHDNFSLTYRQCLKADESINVTQSDAVSIAKGQMLRALRIFDGSSLLYEPDDYDSDVFLSKINAVPESDIEKPATLRSIKDFIYTKHCVNHVAISGSHTLLFGANTCLLTAICNYNIFVRKICDRVSTVCELLSKSGAFGGAKARSKKIKFRPRQVEVMTVAAELLKILANCYSMIYCISMASISKKTSDLDYIGRSSPRMLQMTRILFKSLVESNQAQFSDSAVKLYTKQWHVLRPILHILLKHSLLDADPIVLDKLMSDLRESFSSSSGSDEEEKSIYDNDEWHFDNDIDAYSDDAYDGMVIEISDSEDSDDASDNNAMEISSVKQKEEESEYDDSSSCSSDEEDDSFMSLFSTFTDTWFTKSKSHFIVHVPIAELIRATPSIFYWSVKNNVSGHYNYIDDSRDNEKQSIYESSARWFHLKLIDCIANFPVINHVHLYLFISFLTKYRIIGNVDPSSHVKISGDQKFDHAKINEHVLRSSLVCHYDSNGFKVDHSGILKESFDLTYDNEALDDKSILFDFDLGSSSSHFLFGESVKEFEKLLHHVLDDGTEALFMDKNFIQSFFYNKDA